MALPPEIPSPAIQEVPLPTTSDISSKKRARVSDGSQPPKRGRVEDKITVAPDVEQVEPPVPRQTTELQGEAAPPVIEEPVQQAPAVEETVQGLAEVTVTRAGKKKKKKEMNISVAPLLLKDRRRVEHPAYEIIPVEDVTLATFTDLEAKKVMSAFSQTTTLLAMAEFFYEEGDVTFGERARPPPSTSGSLQRTTIDDSRKRSTTVETPSTPAIEMDTISMERPSITPIPRPQSEKRASKDIEQEMPEAPTVPMPAQSTPKKRKRISPPALSITEITEAPPVAREAERPKVIRPTVEEERIVEFIEPPPPAVRAQKKTPPIDLNLDTARRDTILKILTEWDFSAHDLTIEDVCPKPINRSRIAITFTDLLFLDRMGYVTLHHKPDSLELGVIKPGLKLKKQQLI